MMSGRIFEVNGKFVGYNPENLKVFRLSEDEAKVLQLHLSGFNEEEIAEKSNLKREDISEIIETFNSENPKIRMVSEKELKPHTLELMVATDCNLRCSYCFANGGSYNKKRELMGEETAFKAIEAFNTIGELKKIHFSGGEPLLNFKLIKKIVSHYGKSLSYGLVTNGTIMSDEIIKTFKEYNVGVGISIDGKEEYHNLNRKYPDGRPTYRIAIKNLERLRDNGIYTNIGAVVSKNALKASKQTIKEYVKDLCDHLAQFNCPFGYVPAGDGNPSKEYYESVTECFLTSKEVNPNLSLWKNSRDQISSCTKLVGMPICGELLEKLSVFPDGDAYPCHFCKDYGTSYLCGNVRDNFKDYQKARENVIRDFSREKLLRGHWLKNVIPTMCIWGSLKKENDGFHIDDEALRCEERIAENVLYDLAYGHG